MKYNLAIVLLTIFVSLSCFSKRIAPASVSPIIRGDVVYTVPHFSYKNGTNQNGGYIQALDAKTGLPLWGLQIYITSYKPKLERYVQDVFITSIELNVLGTKLTATNEIGDVYSVNLKTKQVAKVGT